MLWEYRLTLKRPVWANHTGQRKDYTSITLVEMTAMINFAIKKQGIDKRLSWRSYERWEQTTFPEWFRMGIVWINPFIHEIVKVGHKFTLLKGGKYRFTPILQPYEPIEDKISQVRIDASLIG
jgi:hypothetical protein